MNLQFAAHVPAGQSPILLLVMLITGCSRHAKRSSGIVNIIIAMASPILPLIQWGYAIYKRRHTAKATYTIHLVVLSCACSRFGFGFGLVIYCYFAPLTLLCACVLRKCPVGTFNHICACCAASLVNFSRCCERRRVLRPVWLCTINAHFSCMAKKETDREGERETGRTYLDRNLYSRHISVSIAGCSVCTQTRESPVRMPSIGSPIGRSCAM